MRIIDFQHLRLAAFDGPRYGQRGRGRRNKGLPGYGILLQILSVLRREHARERVSSFRSTLTHARRLDKLIGRISSSYAKPVKVIALLTIPLLTQIADRGERSLVRVPIRPTPVSCDCVTIVKPIVPRSVVDYNVFYRSNRFSLSDCYGKSWVASGAARPKNKRYPDTFNSATMI